MSCFQSKLCRRDLISDLSNFLGQLYISVYAEPFSLGSKFGMMKAISAM